MPNYQPNQPEYYSEITNEYKPFNNILGDSVSCTEEEFPIAHQNEENLTAFYISRMPYKPISDEKREEMLGYFPFIKKIPKKDQEHRRQLSENARKAIADLAMRKYFANGRAPYSTERTLRVLMKDDPSKEGMEFNDKMVDIIQNGTPEEIGKEMTRRVNEAMEVFDEMVYQEHSDEWLVENFEKVAKFQEMTLNAQLFKDLIKSKGGPVVSPETMENLLKMERISNRAGMLTTRLQMISHAEYAYIDMEPLITMDEKQYEPLGIFLEGGADIKPTLSQMHIGSTIDFMRGILPLGKHACVMEMVADDFGKDHENAQLTFVNNADEIQRTGCTLAVTDHTLANNLKKGYVVARTDDMVCCYRLDINGKLDKVKTEDLLNDLGQSMHGALDELEEANKGLFIGSKEYSDALKAMRNLNKLIENSPKPLAGDDNLKEQFEKVKEACKAYMDKKNPDGEDLEEFQFKNDREKIRVKAMVKAFNSCKNGMAQIDLQTEAKAAELKAVLGGEGKVEIVRSSDAFAKATNAYGGIITGSTIPESDVGNIADELRADIDKSLGQMLKVNAFDKEEARETFGNMVLLEVIKKGRSVNDDGDIVAGAVERALAAKPEAVVRAIRENAYVKAATEKLDVDLLRQFVTSDKAKTLADKLIQVAKAYAPEKNENVPQKQNEKEFQKEADGPKVGM